VTEALFDRCPMRPEDEGMSIAEATEPWQCRRETGHTGDHVYRPASATGDDLL
jgi:hypothetical protein